VRVNLRGGIREFKARSSLGMEIPTGTSIIVDDLGPDGCVHVRLND
jgi:hypothetical protein